MVKTAVLQRTFSKSETTSWSYKLYKIEEIIIDTLPRYRIDILPEPYNEALPKKTELNMNENKNVMKSFNLN